MHSYLYKTMKRKRRKKHSLFLDDAGMCHISEEDFPPVSERGMPLLRKHLPPVTPLQLKMELTKSCPFNLGYNFERSDGYAFGWEMQCLMRSGW